MNINELINIIKAILHTFVRFLPLGLYSFTYFSTILYKDVRSVLLLFGLLLNDFIGTLYKKFYKVQDRASCSIMGSPGVDGQDAPSLPNAHTEIISFIFGFFVNRAIDKEDKDPITIGFLLALVILTIYSRIETGCKTLNEALLNVIFGLIWGSIYYNLISENYNKAENEFMEKQTCELGYGNYKCSTIKDGTVIVKRPMKEMDKLEKSEADKKEEINETYYD